MSTILDALSKARKEDESGQPINIEPNKDLKPLEEELIFRAGASDNRDAFPVLAQEKSSSLKAGMLIGISVAAIFFVSTVLVVAIMLVKMAGQSDQNNTIATPTATPTPTPEATITQAPPAQNTPKVATTVVAMNLVPTPTPTPTPPPTPVPTPTPQPTPTPTPTPTATPVVFQAATPTPVVTAIQANVTPTPTPVVTARQAVEYTGQTATDEELYALRESLKLNGIVYNKARPKAMLNGRAIGIGSIVQGATVTDIQKDSVTLSYKNRTMTMIY